MTYDPKVYDIASQFLEDHPSLNTLAARVTLACAIQDVIESEIAFMHKLSAREDA